MRKSYGYYQLNKKYYVYDRSDVGNVLKPLKESHKHYLETNILDVVEKHIATINASENISTKRHK